MSGRLACRATLLPPTAFHVPVATTGASMSPTIRAEPALSRDELVLSIRLDTPPPDKLPLTLLLSLPRPKMLKRILQPISMDDEKSPG